MKMKKTNARNPEKKSRLSHLLLALVLIVANLTTSKIVLELILRLLFFLRSLKLYFSRWIVPLETDGDVRNVRDDCFACFFGEVLLGHIREVSLKNNIIQRVNPVRDAGRCDRRPSRP